MRSGTAIGALIREAEQAESKPDFIHKMSIALKESHETEYWLELLCQSGLVKQGTHDLIMFALNEIISLLTAIIKTSKK